MKIRALYVTRTLPILRRVLTPLSVLANRNHTVTMLAVPYFDVGPMNGQDLVILPNWVLTDSELDTLAAWAKVPEHTLCYDLSDPDLLANPAVVAALSLAHLVTVPNDYLAAEVRNLPRPGKTRIRVVPSLVDARYFMLARMQERTKTPCVGCFGDHDWGIVKEAIAQTRERHPRVQFLAENQGSAHKTLGELVTPVDVTIDSYPMILKDCLFGLCPRDGKNGYDTAWALEYGILNRPIIASGDSAYAHLMGKEGAAPVENMLLRWSGAIELLLKDPVTRARYGNAAFELARRSTGGRAADLYLRAYTEMLPHLARV